MLQTPRALRGIVVSPHHLSAQAGLRVLQEGGNAIEAMVAAASTIAVTYPHMNSLGGDNFWLITDGRSAPIGIDASGGAASRACIEFYSKLGFSEIPARGPLAANTVAGAVSGWQMALEISTRWGGSLPLPRLLEDAEHLAREGIAVTRSQHSQTASKRAELENIPSFVEHFMPDGEAPVVGSIFKQPALAQTLQHLAHAGLDDFYRGELARGISADLEQLGSPVGSIDLEDYNASEVVPLYTRVSTGTLYNMPPPTQGLASLIILGLFDRLHCPSAETFDYVHLLLEATKQAFYIRDNYITDPNYMAINPARFLTDEELNKMARGIDPNQAAPWDNVAVGGDTVWLGAIDRNGCAISFIQSLYWEFGSGVVLPNSGILWQNRGTSFSLEGSAKDRLEPGRKPFHTIHPALANLDDGRTLVYGAMGGEGQPQTQAMIYTRYAQYEQELQQCVTAPRWLLGRTWGAPKNNVRIESRFAPEVLHALEQAGHDIEVVGPFDEIMGHAGAIVRYPSGVIEGAADPRSDGIVATY